ncbi:MAG TPA: type II toxin-antitoxin system RelE/ParE family toxin [Thermoanaerobaculia bacterium]|nr:type II toxin-antitoxin system RelE/ParE family toxin [Thermoanaerobaculia bacterium]
MSFRFKVAARADRHIRAAANWWAKNRASVPAMFAEDLELAFGLIEQFPQAGEEVPHRRISPLRRVLLARTQYYLYYAVYLEDRVIEVLALWHTSRARHPRL